MSRRFKGLFWVVCAALSVTSSKGAQEGKAVSLLFDNDGDWEHYGDHASALLYHEPVTGVEASAICQKNNESLFPLKKFSEVSAHLRYLKFNGDVADDQGVWVEDKGKPHAIGTTEKGPKLPFLCTNSAPHTTKADTDFSSHPRSYVISNDTVFTGTRDHLSFRFTGIPFAQSPTGSLRFKHAQPWNGPTVDATSLKPGCLQYGYFANNDLGVNPWGTSEDCLYLNVYTPFIPASASEPTASATPALKPVLFWIHGGGNFYGLGSDATFDGGPLSTRSDLVVVTFNYRLNIFSSLALNDGIITGNYGLSDKIAALQWVKDNIRAFGGDPDRVTVAGQSAGGWSVIDFLSSPKAKGLFAGAISQSGGAGIVMKQEQAAGMAAPIIAPLGCEGTGVERLKCLQGLPAETLLQATQAPSFWPTVEDGEFIVSPSMIHQVAAGSSAINSVPLLVGFVPDEGQSSLAMFPTITPNSTDFNETLILALSMAGIPPPLAEVIQTSGLWEINDEFTPYNATQNVFGNVVLTCPAEQMIKTAVQTSAFPALYVYTMLRGYALSFFNPFGLCSFPAGKPELRSKSYICHSADLYEVFGTFHIFDQPVRVPEDIQYASFIQDLWGSFVRTGNPNPDKELLKARGVAYQGTLSILEKGWVWPQYPGGGEGDRKVAMLDVPEPFVTDGMPDEKNGRCDLLMGTSSLFQQPPAEQGLLGRILSSMPVQVVVALYEVMKERVLGLVMSEEGQTKRSEL